MATNGTRGLQRKSLSSQRAQRTIEAIETYIGTAISSNTSNHSSSQETSSERGVKVGGILTVESAIHISNVMLVDSDGKATRSGTRKDENGKNVRISRRTGKDL